MLDKRERWELAHEVEDEIIEVLGFLVNEEISFAKARESIIMIIVGNTPALLNSKD